MTSLNCEVHTSRLLAPKWCWTTFYVTIGLSHLIVCGLIRLGFILYCIKFKDTTNLTYKLFARQQIINHKFTRSIFFFANFHTTQIEPMLEFLYSDLSVSVKKSCPLVLRSSSSWIQCWVLSIPDTCLSQKLGLKKLNSPTIMNAFLLIIREV